MICAGTLRPWGFREGVNEGSARGVVSGCVSRLVCAPRVFDQDCISFLTIDLHMCSKLPLYVVG